MLEHVSWALSNGLVRAQLVSDASALAAAARPPVLWKVCGRGRTESHAEVEHKAPSEHLDRFH